MVVQLTGEPAAAAGPDLGRIGIGLGLVGMAIAALGLVGWAAPWAAPEPVTIEIHFSAFGPERVTVPAGVPVTIVLHNGDPIDHEWIVGDAATHARHRTGTEPVHDERPTEISIPPGATIETTIVFERPGEQAFICHLPGHEAYGMAGTVLVEG
jgi:uncharacterized cupredoxin-like copper-binding protein